MFNRLQIRILFILLAITAIFVVGSLIVNQWMVKKLDRAKNDFQQQQNHLLDNAVSLNSNITRSLALSFSHWDEMVGFVQNRDTNWANFKLRSNISGNVANHEWVYTAEFEPIYYSCDSPVSSIREALPNKDQLSDIVKEDTFLHFFHKTEVGLVEVFGAPIQPLSDRNRISTPVGWFFVGKTWSPAVLNEIAQLTAGEVMIDTTEVLAVQGDKAKDNPILIKSTYVLKGWSGMPVGTLQSVAAFPFLNEYRQGSMVFFYLIILLLVVLLIMISVLLFKFVELPLRYLNKTLEYRDIRYIEPLKNYRSEFGKLTRSIQSVFQKEELLQETEKRRRLESDLRRSEQRFKLLVENLPDILWIANADGDTIYYSSNIQQVLGYEPEDIIGVQDFWEKNIHPDDYQKVVSRYSAFVVENNSFDVEYRLRNKDGHYCWISEKAISKFEHDGIQYCCGRISDITAEKNIEIKLAESEKQFRALFEVNPFGVLIVDLADKTILSANPAMYLMLGYQDKELEGVAIEKITPAEDYEKMLVVYSDSQKSHKNVFTTESRVYRKEGDLIWINLTATFFAFENDQSSYAFGILENITEKKHILDKLTTEHNLLLSLMENVPDLIFFKDNQGRFIAANQAARLFFEKMGILDPIGLIDVKLLENLKENNDSIIDDVAILKSGVSVINKVEKVVLPNNETIWFLVNKVPIISHNRKNDVLVAILRNITERVESELKLQQYAQELKDLNLSKDKFVSILAHDLKNPFNAILGFSSVLEQEYEEYDDQERMHFIKNIHQAAENTFSLIQNILEWSRSQTGRINYDPAYHDLNQIFKETLRLLKPILNTKSIKVINNIRLDTRVYVDENMMKTVLRNLISNALKFSPKHSSIILNSRDLNHGMLEVTVEDQGIGIPEEALEKLFKIDESYRREGTEGEQGTGLGLILCKEFIEKNGGLIWVKSTVGQGSKFHFTIPVEPLQHADLKN